MRKSYFPIFENQPELVYLDTASSSLTLKASTDAMDDYYHNFSANVARGLYAMSEKATAEYESVRDSVKDFVNAEAREEIIFTSGTTESLNTVAQGLKNILTEDSRIAVTAMDHHANFVPWQKISEERSCAFDVIDVTPDGQIDKADFAAQITDQTMILALPYISNVLGTINPVKDLIAKARVINPSIIVVVDAAQAAAHFPIDVQDLDCDFLALSGHKMYGPTGVGVLYGRKNLLEKVEPLTYGGEMIETVSSEKSTLAELPHRLEAGTPNIAGVIGLGPCVNFLNEAGFEKIVAHEKELTEYATTKLKETFADEVTIYGPENSESRIGVVSFTIKGIHPHDLAQILDDEKNVAIRAGFHCAMPLHAEALSIPATARASFGLYTEKSDIDALVDGLKKALEVFAK